MKKNNANYSYVIIGVVKWLITINRIQNKSFCLHVCTVNIYYVYIYGCFNYPANNFWFPERSGNISFWFPERSLLVSKESS